MITACLLCTVRITMFLALGLSMTALAEVDKDALPKVEDGFAINFFVKEPHIINPSSLCFDKRGRLYVGAGPQYRNPKKDSPTDDIKILIDADNDGDDVADITASIMALKPLDAAEPSAASGAVTVTHKAADKKVVVEIGGKLFNEYRYGNKSKPIIYPIIGPYEIPMTRNYPMKKGVAGEATDHPHHQSMHFNHPINGKDFWHGRGGAHIRNDEIVKAEVDGNEALIVSRNSWVHDHAVTCTDTTEIRSGITEGGRYIDYKVSIHASNGDIRFEDSKEGTMSIRMHPALRLTGDVAKGSAINSEGIRGKAVWGQIAKWVDYWGPIGDKTVGIAIFDHPQNPRHPTTWMARDYGMVNVNPFGKKYFKRGQGAMDVKSGDSVTFLYRFFFHAGSHEEANIAKQYEKWGSGEK